MSAPPEASIWRARAEEAASETATCLPLCFLIVGGDLLQRIGQRGGAEDRDIRGESRKRRQGQQQDAASARRNLVMNSPYERRDTRGNITFSRGEQNPCPRPPLRVRMPRMTGLFLRLPIGVPAIWARERRTSGTDRGNRLDPLGRRQDETQLSPRLAVAAGHRKNLRRLDPGPADRRQGGGGAALTRGATTSSSISAMPSAAPPAPSRPIWTRWRN